MWHALLFVVLTLRPMAEAELTILDGENSQYGRRVSAASTTCYGFTILRGICLSYVENGEAVPQLCVD